MSEFSAKTLRKASRAKAARLTGDPKQKVDSSDWTPPEALNADIKTGARPLSRRAFKSGGKVCGEKAKANMGRAPRKAGGSAPKDYANAKVNRNVKDANEEREGIKHVGGFKKGGRAKKLSGGALDALSFLSPAAMVYNLAKGGDKDKDEKKHGGRTKREYGGRGPGERTQHEMKRRDATQAATDYGADPRVTEDVLRQKTRAFEKSAEQTAYKKGGRTKKMDGGMMGVPGMAPMAGPDPRLGMVAPTRMRFAGAQGTPYKKGGKVKEKSFKELREEYGTQVMKRGGKAHGDEAMDRALIKKMVKPSARAGKADGGDMGAGSGKRTDRPSNVYQPDYNEESVDKAIRGSRQKIGGKEAAMIKQVLKGRTGRASGGRTKGKGKTNINIIISAGGKGQPQDAGPGMPPGMPMGGPDGMPMSLQKPMPGMPGLPPGMPPGMPAGGPPQMGQPPMPPMARKSGGRVSKIAKSYKDMEAGAASGEGRLQKTDIAKRIPKKKEDGVIETDKRGYPNKVIGATGGRTAHKAGGKVYRSYKDMDAGAGSGMGRLEKEEIQKRKH